MQQITLQRPLAEQVYHILLEEICTGRYDFGERLSQDEIAQSHNVSRQPVLQALGLLKAQGFLRSAGRRGLMASPLDLQSVRDLYEYRGAIDALSARKAARSCTPALAKKAAAILEQGEAARRSRSLIDLSLADMAFHRWIYEVSGNLTVMETMNHYWNHTRRVMCMILTIDEDWPGRVWDEHRAICAAIAAGNGEKAERLAGAHVEKACRALCRELAAKLRGAGEEQKP